MRCPNCNSEIDDKSKICPKCRKKLNRRFTENKKRVLINIIYAMALVIFALIIFFGLKDYYIKKEIDKFFAGIGTGYALLFPLGMIAISKNGFSNKKKAIITAIVAMLIFLLIMLTTNHLYLGLYLNSEFVIAILSICYSGISAATTLLIAGLTIISFMQKQRINIFTPYANNGIKKIKYTWNILTFYIIGAILLMLGLSTLVYIAVTHYDKNFAHSFSSMELFFGVTFIDVGFVLDQANRIKQNKE